MKFLECVDLLSNVNETKRIASAYVEDCRRLNIDELKACIKKVREQYVSENNIFNKINNINLHTNSVVRIIAPILIRDYLLNTDEFLSTCKDTNNAIINY